MLKLHINTQRILLEDQRTKYQQFILVYLKKGWGAYNK